MKRKDFIYVILIFIGIVLLNINWTIAVIKENDLGLEEGYLDLTSVLSLSESQNPLFYDSRDYGQPTEGIPYGKLPILAIPILFNFIIHNETSSFVLSFVLILFISSFIFYYLLSNELKLTSEISLLFTLLYLLSHPLLINMFTHGHFRYLIFISLPIIYLYVWIKIVNVSTSSRWFLLLIISLVSLIYMLTSIIAFMFYLILLIYITPFATKIDNMQYLKIISKIIIYVVPWLIIWFVYYKYYYLVYFNFEGFSSSNYRYSEMSQPLLNFFGNIGRENRNPMEIQAATNPLFNLILSLPFFLFLTYFVTTNIRKNYTLLILILSIIFLANGTYGPFSAIFNEYSLPFRAPGRTFLPAVFPFLIIFGAIGVNNIVKNIEMIISSRKFWILFIMSGLTLLSLAYEIGTNYQFAYEINPKLNDAYSNISAYNRIMMIPVWGNVGSGVSLSYGGTYKYQLYPTVGYSIIYVNEYLTVRNNLKNAFSPPNPWESPFLGTWFFSDFIWGKIMRDNDYNGFYQNMKLIPNLKYLAIYRHILPENIVYGLTTNPAVKIIYENEDISMLEVKSQTSNEIITSNNAFLLYTSSWQYGHSTVLTLLNKYNVTFPIIFEATTPWYMLKSDQFNEDMTLVFNNIYSTKDLVLDYYLFNDKFNKDRAIKFNKEQINVAGFWQPSYGKMHMYLENNGNISGKINIDKKGEYRILIRTVYNGMWRGRYSVTLDGNKIMNYVIEKNRFGWRWINSSNLFLEKGDHELKITGTEEYVDINSVIVIAEDEYNNVISGGHELNKDIGQKRCISGYEFEHMTGFENISEENAISGGHAKPYVVEGIVNTNIFSPCKNIKYAIVLGNITELKINNVSLNPINLNNGLILYKLSEILNKNDDIFLYANGDGLDAIWLTNFDPTKLYNIKTNIVDTPKSYWGEYTFQSSQDQKFILLLKSYSPMFDIKYKDNEYRPYVTNMMFNGFYVKEPKSFNNNSDNNISVELSYLNALVDI